MPRKYKNRERFFRNIDNFETLLSDILKSIGKKIAKELRMKDMSVQQRVFEGKYPANGMKDLRDVALKEAAKYLSLFEDPAKAKKVFITETMYVEFLQTLVAVMYTTCPQGRPGAIESLTIKDLDDIYSKCYATSTKFKNAKYLHYQAIIFTLTAQQLVRVFMEYLRPVVQPRNQTVQRDDWLFLDWAGRNLKGIHLLLKRFFDKFLQLHITSNTCRKIMETEADQRDLTQGQRDAMHRTVGHGLTVATQFYILNHMGADVITAIRAYGTPDEDPTLQRMIAAPAVVYERDIWGVEHPDPSTAQRARWTKEEKDYLQHVLDDLNAANTSGEPSNNILAHALKIIKADAGTRQIFHVRHVRDSGRLRAGVQTQEKNG